MLTFDCTHACTIAARCSPNSGIRATSFSVVIGSSLIRTVLQSRRKYSAPQYDVKFCDNYLSSDITTDKGGIPTHLAIEPSAS